MPGGKGCKQPPVGQALQGSPNLHLLTGFLPSVAPPAGEGPKHSLVGEASEGLLQGSSVVVEPAAGVPPGIEGAQQSGVGQLGKGLLQSQPVEALALYTCTPCPEHLQPKVCVTHCLEHVRLTVCDQSCLLAAACNIVGLQLLLLGIHIHMSSNCMQLPSYSAVQSSTQMWQDDCFVLKLEGSNTMARSQAQLQEQSLAASFKNSASSADILL